MKYSITDYLFFLVLPFSKVYFYLIRGNNCCMTKKSARHPLILNIAGVILLICNSGNFQPATRISSTGNVSQTDSLAVLVNQVAFNSSAPKFAVIKSNTKRHPATFNIVDAFNGSKAYSGSLTAGAEVNDWQSGIFFQTADFSSFTNQGKFRITVEIQGKEFDSPEFIIDENALGSIAFPAILNFFKGQRASSPEELEADKAIKLYGSDKTVDLHGGWCDASGDVSKYFSHLAYTNFMSPQQIPLVTWSMINTVETAGKFLSSVNSKKLMEEEALYGADYLMRSLSEEGFFYMTVFSYFNKDPKARRVVGLLADSKTTTDYQCAYREGGGMAIASLARISLWSKSGDFKPSQYLQAAEKAFLNLQANNKKYDDDGKENIIDDYCSLMAASELWLATNKNIYRDEARKRTRNLEGRLSRTGYFIADDSIRPFWHASDAGLPVIALARYLDRETDDNFRRIALSAIKTAIDYQLRVTGEIINPFGYPRQSFLYKGKVRDGFFIPHENESGWWWQGEDARLASLATAAIIGGRLVYSGNYAFGTNENIASYASRCISWILGCNPYGMCMMFGYGEKNVPYMVSMYGHGSGRGGISNGITGKNIDGSGIEFKVEDNGNEWRWSEQWIPHTGWFLQAVAAMTINPGKPEYRILVLTERGGQHEGFVSAALKWLDNFAGENDFQLDILNNTGNINDSALDKYKLFIQLDYPPYSWSDTAMASFTKYIEYGKGGWIGFHHATLLGEFDGFSMWNWFSAFMGDIRFENYIAGRATGTVIAEDTLHPVLKGVAGSFDVDQEEWYTYNKSPRNNVRVLAHVDESSYRPSSGIKMGDHPVIWTNCNMKPRNVYIQMGHDSSLFKNENFLRIFRNAIEWASGESLITEKEQ